MRCVPQQPCLRPRSILRSVAVDRLCDMALHVLSHTETIHWNVPDTLLLGRRAMQVPVRRIGFSHLHPRTRGAFPRYYSANTVAPVASTVAASVSSDSDCEDGWVRFAIPFTPLDTGNGLANSSCSSQLDTSPCFSRDP